MSDNKTLELQIQILAQQAIAQVGSLSGDLKSLATQAKTFSADSKGVAESLKRCESEASRAAASFKLFGVSSAEVKRQQDTAKRAAIELVEAGLKPESQEVQNLVSQYKKLEAQAKQIDKANANNISSFGELKNAVTQTAAAVALIKTVSKLKDLTGFALAQSDAFQNARNEFGILLGDMEAGAAMFDRIKAFNDKTPFSLETTKQAVNVLLSADVPLTKINERLTQFGDLSQGNAQRFTSYINSFSMGAAKGKVDMQVLNTYLHQGVPILAELARGFNVDKEAIVEMVSQGKVSFADFTAALDRLTAEGGKYFGGMELGSRSLAAMQEGLKESTNALAASFGDILAPAISKVLEIAANLINFINESPLAKGILAGAVVALTGYLTIMAVKQAALAVKTWLAFAAQMGFNSALAVTNPALIAGIAAATAATIAIVAYAAVQQKAADSANTAALAAQEEAGAHDAAAEAARRHAEALNDMGVSGQRGMLKEAQNEVARLYQEKARIERQMTSTPQRSAERLELQPGSGMYMTIDNGPNPAYAQLQQTLTSVNNELFQAQANVNAITVRMGELREASLAAFGTDWQDKLLNGAQALNREEDKAIGELKAKAYSAFKDGFEHNRAYQAELAALHLYYNRKRAEIEKKDIEHLGSVWQEKRFTGIKAIDQEQKRSLDELQAKAQKIYGDDFKTQAAYIDELAALQAHYYDKREDYNRDQRQRELDAVRQEHELRMAGIRAEWELRRETARQDGNYAQFAASEAMLAMEGTDVGQMISVIQSGGNPWMMLISIVIKAVAQLESFSEALNFITNFVKDVFGKIDYLVKNAMSSLYDALDELGEIIAEILPMITFFTKCINDAIAIVIKILMPALKIIGEVFLWLHNKILVPFGNGVIDVINAIIGLINKIPGVDVKKLKHFEYAGQIAEDLAKEMERRKEEITKLYERQKDRVRDELSAQISSIRQQYELGLISRALYEQQAQQYQGVADLKLYDINQEMLHKLEEIEFNTGAALTDDQRRAAEDATENNAKATMAGAFQTGGAFIDPVTTGIVSAAVDFSKGNIGDGIGNVLTGGLWGGIRKLFKFDTGTSYVPYDMTAVVHQGEGVIPRTFNDGIRAGDYALIGRSSPAGGRELTRTGSTSVNVSVVVEGSVIKERGLVEAIYEGIAAGIESGNLNPLPA